MFQKSLLILSVLFVIGCGGSNTTGTSNNSTAVDEDNLIIPNTSTTTQIDSNQTIPDKNSTTLIDTNQTIPDANNTIFLIKHGNVSIEKNIPFYFASLLSSEINSTDFTYTITEQPTQGILSGIPPKIVYTPNTDVVGLDKFVLIAHSTQQNLNITKDIVLTINNNIPIANAGIDQETILSSLPIQLDGKDSRDLNHDSLTYEWSIKAQPEGSDIALINSDSRQCTFIPSKTGQYQMQLIVFDGTAHSLTDNITVTVKSYKNIVFYLDNNKSTSLINWKTASDASLNATAGISTQGIYGTFSIIEDNLVYKKNLQASTTSDTGTLSISNNGFTSDINISIKHRYFSSVAIGSSYMRGIKTDGTIWAWGSNHFGNFGDGSYIDKYIPTLTKGKQWKLITQGNTHSLSIKTDGTLWASGNNQYGQLGDGSRIRRSSPVKVGNDNNWSLVSAAASHSLGIKKDGTLWAWGYNNYGQLGDGSTDYHVSPTQIGSSSDWKTIHTAYGFTVAQKIDGTLWAWGSNSFGQLGNDTMEDSQTPIQIGQDNDWYTFDIGSHHVVAIKNDGTLWAWGINSFGQLGNDTRENSTIPKQIGIEKNWTTLAIGASHSLALKKDGTLWAWGGMNIYGQLGDGTQFQRHVPTQIGNDNNWNNIYAAYSNSVATKTDGSLWVWGSNSWGQLGDGRKSTIKSPSSEKVSTGSWKMQSSGTGIKSDGTLWAWGDKIIDILNNGTYIDKSIPKQIGSDTKWNIVSSKEGHTMAIKTDGTLWGRGNNYDGQLGDGRRIYSEPLLKQIGTDNTWQTVSTGKKHTVALKVDGTLWAWGDDKYGQVGDGNVSSDNKLSPIQLGSETNWSAINSGIYYTLALKTDGTLWAWGRNDYGQLGDGSIIDRASPVQIGTLNNWRSINGGYFHSAALNSEGVLWTWGRNDYGQLGDNTLVDKHIPTEISSLGNWKSVSVENYHGVGLKTDGTLWAWGSNSFGQLGDGTTRNKSTPIKIGYDDNWGSVIAGNSNYTLAIKKDGSRRSWGINRKFDLGLGFNYFIPSLLE